MKIMFDWINGYCLLILEGLFFIKKKKTLVSCFDNILYIDENSFIHPNSDALWEKKKESPKIQSQTRIGIETLMMCLYE